MLANLPAILLAAAAVIGSITSLVALFVHRTGPQHRPNGQHTPARKL